MLPFQKASRVLMARLGRSQVLVQPRANVIPKPPKDPISPAGQAFALTVMFAVFLIPPGWFLLHLEDYKNPTKD